ncbi:hypothetical protein vseg_021147 [Gypsophila vaccaria]
MRYCSLHVHIHIQPPYHKPIIKVDTRNHRNPSKIITFAVHNSKEDSSNQPKSDRTKLAFHKYNTSLPGDEDARKEEIPEVVTVAVEKDGIPTKIKGLANIETENEDDGKEEVPEAVRIAMEKAREYKKSKGNINNDKNYKEKDQMRGNEGGGEEKVPEAVRIAMGKALEYKKNKGVPGSSSSPEKLNVTMEKDEIYLKNKELANDKTENEDDGKEEVPEAVRIAMEKAREYKKNKGNINDDTSYKERDQLRGGREKDVPEAVKIAMGKALEYKKNKGGIDSSSGPEKLKVTGLTNGGANNLRGKTIEKNTNKKEDRKVSSIDFVGLGFADKKSGRGLPAGLVPVVDPYPDDDSQEVEIIVGDASRFGNATSSETEKSSEEESPDLYKPKVSTWGVFPRPSNISETFGGGRTIRPGDELETTEDKAAKEARTRQLLAAYKRKIGLNLDPKLKAECQKALSDGDSLMDGGRLKEALPFYQKVMDNLPFQTELHGLAALQWSISQDSLGRTEEARTMYEKLQSHPIGQVSKKARQFMFSFQAMEMLKVTKSTLSPKNTGYGSYFEAFVEDKPSYTSGSTDVTDDGVSQALPYIIFLASPILLVLLAAARKGM